MDFTPTLVAPETVYLGHGKVCKVIRIHTRWNRVTGITATVTLFNRPVTQFTSGSFFGAFFIFAYILW